MNQLTPEFLAKYDAVNATRAARMRDTLAENRSAIEEHFQKEAAAMSKLANALESGNADAIQAALETPQLPELFKLPPMPPPDAGFTGATLISVTPVVETTSDTGEIALPPPSAPPLAAFEEPLQPAPPLEELLPPPSESTPPARPARPSNKKRR